MPTSESIFNWVSDTVRNSFSGVIGLFTNERTGPFLAGVLICLGLVVLFYIILSYVRSTLALYSAIRVVRNASGEDEHARRSSFAIQYDAIDRSLFSNKRTSNSWREFRETLIRPDNPNSGVIISNSSRPNLFFNISALHMNFHFVRHVPNLFVGLGLLGTFLGLIAALTAALGSFAPGAGSDGAQDAIRKLLTTASAKFYVSAAALSVSIALTTVLRAFGSMTSYQIFKFNNLLEERLLFATAENIANQQLDILKDQSVQLRLFNTDLAMTIGRSVREAVSETNGALLAKLENIAETFSKLAEASRIGAGEAIGKAVEGTVATTLKETSEAIHRVGSSLGDLPERMNSMVKSIEEAGAVAANQQKELSEEIGNQLREALSSGATAMIGELKRGAVDTTSQLSETSVTLASGAGAIADAIMNLSEGGSELSQTLREIATENRSVIQQLANAGQTISSASQELRTAASGVASQISAVVETVSNLREQHSSTFAAVRDAQEQIRANVERLTAEWQRHVGRFDNVDAKLAETFGRMSDQISVQTDGMMKHVGRMDSALARAVGTLETLVEDLGNRERVS